MVRINAWQVAPEAFKIMLQLKCMQKQLDSTSY